jgi:hypothetical protein
MEPQIPFQNLKRLGQASRRRKLGTDDDNPSVAENREG